MNRDNAGLGIIKLVYKARSGTRRIRKLLHFDEREVLCVGSFVLKLSLAFVLKEVE